MQRRRSSSLAAMVLMTIQALSVSATAQPKEVLKQTGVAVTGPNDRCGAPAFTIPGMTAGAATHGTSMGRWDPSGTSAAPLVPTDCAEPDGAALAGFVDGPYFADQGWSTPDARLENLLLREAPISAGNGVWAQIPVAGTLPPNPLPPTHAEPRPPITLESWLEAKGRLKIVCEDDDEAVLKLSAKNLIPHGVYSVWGVWRDFAATELLTAPLGGLPNLLVADKRGKAKYQRELRFCPMGLAPDGSSLMYVRLIWHADGGGSGSTPADPALEYVFVGVGGGLPFTSNLPLGVHRFDHLGFRVGAAEELE